MRSEHFTVHAFSNPLRRPLNASLVSYYTNGRMLPRDTRHLFGPKFMSDVIQCRT